jgi:benzodiazapine receptor
MPDISRQSILNTAAIAILPVIVASLLGQWATFPNIAGWYAGLVKPTFNPPNWIFAPVWTTLYILMAWAAWRITSLPFGTDGRKTALALFFAQLAMNSGWSWLFFGLHSPVGGLLNIVPQLFLILLTIVWFWRLDRVAALCLVPLAGWVGFASLLNYAIWQLNG